MKVTDIRSDEPIGPAQSQLYTEGTGALVQDVRPNLAPASTQRQLATDVPLHRAFIQRQQHVNFINQSFTQYLAEELQLIEVQAPLLTDPRDGVQDTLSGSEKAVKVSVSALDTDFEVVHSLAKWKRQTLAVYDFPVGKGILTHMKALRPDEACLSPIHSVFVDQWDWEQVIAPSQRTNAHLQRAARAVYRSLQRTLNALQLQLTHHTPYLCQDTRPTPDPLLTPAGMTLPPELTFVSAEALLQRYPSLTPKARERAITKEHSAVFITGIGASLSDGKPHDARAPDYDDWSSMDEHGQQGLNGDLLVWSDVLNDVIELSSMGVRVDAQALTRQLAIAGREKCAQLPWHQALLQGRLPASVGGGIGQSRVCMYLLQLPHIGYVQSGVWSAATRNAYPGLL